MIRCKHFDISKYQTPMFSETLVSGERVLTCVSVVVLQVLLWLVLLTFAFYSCPHFGVAWVDESIIACSICPILHFDLFKPCRVCRRPLQCRVTCCVCNPITSCLIKQAVHSFCLRSSHFNTIVNHTCPIQTIIISMPHVCWGRRHLFWGGDITYWQNKL